MVWKDGMRRFDQMSQKTEKSLFTSMNRQVGRLIQQYGLIEDGDRILVAMSGGKDSSFLLHILSDFQKKAPVDFELFPVHLDQGQPGHEASPLQRLVESMGYDLHVEYQDTYSTVLDLTPEGKTYCAVCSRLRRGILYRLAREKGCNRIALGHHREDLLSTFLMNAFFNGKLGSMPPVYRIEEGDLHVIRPLATVSEDDIRSYVEIQGWTVLPCNLCGSQEGARRKQMETMLSEMERSSPQIKNSLLAALGNIHRDELMDQSLWIGDRRAMATTAE
ncbi:MAG: tRNA 2-thiocytidine(32) synthetase TtcA [Leptospiraceae bacterium]|nr:tRNA 2-thiocytidine(32) synthetase TtcA [Leptospiraceae bacterium]